MENKSAKQLYGLIGYPVKHSYSAVMHNAAFAHCKMNAVYELFEVPPEKCKGFLEKTIFEKKIKGFNVTVPHKEKVYAYLKEKGGKISADAAKMKAVNTVVVEKEGRLSGFNTDGAGFMQDLIEHGVKVKDKNISLIGAGGGAKAVVYVLACERPKNILIFDADPLKSHSLVDIVKEFYPEQSIEAVDSMEALSIKETDLLINATPVGMKETDPLLVKKEWLHQEIFVYDLIYNPTETKLLKMAKAAGCRTANGLGMLLHQGCLAFVHWTHKEAPVDVMRRALEERLHA